MEIRPQHRAAAKWLVEHQFDGLTLAEQAEQISIGSRAFYNWLHDAAFLAVLAEAQAAWRASIEHIPPVQRRIRLEELWDLYQSLPKDYIDKNVEIRAPHPTTGEMINQLVPVRRSNALAKAKLLEQIAMEVAGDVAAKFEALKLALGMQDQNGQPVNGRPQLKVASGNGEPTA